MWLPPKTTVTSSPFHSHPLALSWERSSWRASTLSLIGPGNELALLSVLAMVRAPGRRVWGQSILPVQRSGHQTPVSLGGRDLKPESTHCVKASVSACAFLVVAWHGDPCLDWQPLLETRSSHTCFGTPESSRSIGSRLGHR